MPPYFMILIGLSGLALLVQAQRNRAPQLAPCGRMRARSPLTMPNIVWFLIMVVLILFAGLRSPAVGTDTAGYVQRFLLLDAQNLYWDYGSMELGSKLLYFVALAVSDSPIAVLVLFAALTVPAYITVIRRDSINPALSLFLFIALGYYLFLFNGARQAVAAAFYMIALSAMLRGRFKHYVGWTLAAALFHTSAIIALPLYFLFRRPFSAKILLYIAASAAVVILFSTQAFALFGEINERYAAYIDREETGGFLISAFYAVTTVIFIVVRPLVAPADRQRYDIYLNLSVLGSAIYLAVTLSGLYVEIVRAAFYFQVATMFLWPMAIKAIPSGPLRLVAILGVLVVHLLFYWIYLNEIGNLTPYALNSGTYW